MSTDSAPDRSGEPPPGGTGRPEDISVRVVHGTLVLGCARCGVVVEVDGSAALVATIAAFAEQHAHAAQSPGRPGGD